MERHYGMDWLRIGAFALLILYHIGMVFVPWGFHIKTAQPMVLGRDSDAADQSVAADVAVRRVGLCQPRFVRQVCERAQRSSPAATPGCSIPLFFGDRRDCAARRPGSKLTDAAWLYRRAIWQFWTTGLFPLRHCCLGIVMPTWNHLWFVVYLWVYTLVLGGADAAPRRRRSWQPAVRPRLRRQPRAVRCRSPSCWSRNIWLFHREEDTHKLYDDWIAHLQYFPALLFGFGLAGSRSAMAGSFAKWWKAVGGACARQLCGDRQGMLVIYPDFSFPSRAVIRPCSIRIAREIEAWRPRSPP